MSIYRTFWLKSGVNFFSLHIVSCIQCSYVAIGSYCLDAHPRMQLTGVVQENAGSTGQASISRGMSSSLSNLHSVKYSALHGDSSVNSTA